MKTQMMRTVGAATGLMLSLAAAVAGAQEPASRIDPLQQLNGSVASLARSVSQSVVQVLVTSGGPLVNVKGELSGPTRSSSRIRARTISIA